MLEIRDKKFCTLLNQNIAYIRNSEQTVNKILKAENITSILVTHDITEAITMSDRIIVLTKRPASVKNIHNIDLAKFGTPLERREHPELSSYFNKLWKELQQ